MANRPEYDGVDILDVDPADYRVKDLRAILDTVREWFEEHEDDFPHEFTVTDLDDGSLVVTSDNPTPGDLLLGYRPGDRVTIVNQHRSQ